MDKVIFTYSSGRSVLMQPRYAKILDRLGRGTFRECDNQKEVEPLGNRITKNADGLDFFSDGDKFSESVSDHDLDSMGRDALIAFAEGHNKRIDRRWSDERIRDELREQAL